MAAPTAPGARLRPAGRPEPPLYVRVETTVNTDSETERATTFGVPCDRQQRPVDSDRKHGLLPLYCGAGGRMLVWRARMSYQIGEVAKRVGMTVEGLRFYERRGLVKPAGRSPSRYRLYGEEEIRTLRFVKATQEMGFSLREIEELLEIRQGKGDNCEAMRERLAEKLEDVRRRIKLLRTFGKDLEVGIARCDGEIRRGRKDECPVLEELGSSV